MLWYANHVPCFKIHSSSCWAYQLLTFLIRVLLQSWSQLNRATSSEVMYPSWKQSTSNDYSMQGCKPQPSLTFCCTSLQSHPISHGTGWGPSNGNSEPQLLPLPIPVVFTLSQLLIQRAHPNKYLHANFYPRVYFLENSTIDRFLPMECPTEII